MKRLIKKSEFFDGLQANKNYYEIYKNPSSTDLNNILNSINEDKFNYIRGIICDSGDMFVWAGGLLHDKAISQLNIPDGMHFDIEKDFSIEIKIPDISLNEFIKKIYPFKTYLNNLGINNQSSIYIYCNKYATSLNDDFNKIKIMGDLWNFNEEN